MQARMAGVLMISIGAAMTKVGQFLSSRQPKTTSLEASQQLNGNPHHLQVSGSLTSTRSCSALMRAGNILSQRESGRLLNVNVIAVRCLEGEVPQT